MLYYSSAQCTLNLSYLHAYYYSHKHLCEYIFLFSSTGNFVIQSTRFFNNTDGVSLFFSFVFYMERVYTTVLLNLTNIFIFVILHRLFVLFVHRYVCLYTTLHGPILSDWVLVHQIIISCFNKHLEQYQLLKFLIRMFLFCFFYFSSLLLDIIY